ncbi:B3/4 domain-containing protein [Bacillus sp. JCM 19034]|uniref:B3/B4 domain-containing protein n=1 Tax=Bacillus sp. JCM 19034 TaxID=1481928 RepID=UPI0007858C8A|nr:phenylalanine--tRNA ligase beta subunit-related protein [Bacillus sp. JCM 19034]
MVSIKIDPSLQTIIPNLKMGIIQYHHIEIADSPQMLKGRLQFFQETLQVEFATKPIADVVGVAEWRRAFKALHIDPNRYRPSNEALLRRIKKGNFLPFIHSAVDLNTFFSLQYEIPIGIYDLSMIDNDITIRLGQSGEEYNGINGRINQLKGKLISADKKGPFGSPIVDSNQAKVTENTTSALHIFYLRPSMELAEAKQLIQAAAEMFTHIHGGVSSKQIIHINGVVEKW